MLGYIIVRLQHRLNDDMKSFNYIAREDFNRGDLIRRVGLGDSVAAYDLAIYYGTKDIYEAQLYWFKVAKKLGYPGISDELLEANERSILDAYRE